jgi:hypothetical protein
MLPLGYGKKGMADPLAEGHNLNMLDATILPASKFPEQADEYERDKCGRLVTKHLNRDRAHVEKPIGRERYPPFHE